MSGFVDFVVAGSKEAKAVAKENTPRDRWPAAAAKFIFDYQLAELWSLLAGEEQNDDFPELADEGPWRVYSLPAAFVKLLAAVKPKDVPKLAEQWYEDWDAPELQDEASLGELITELTALAKKVKAGKTLLVRESQG